MNRLSLTLSAAALLAGASQALATAPASWQAVAKPSVIVVSTHDELNRAWCAADPTIEHIIVLPASLFVDSEQLVCNGSIYKLYRVIENDDPDDFEYFLDPPFGHTTRLGCDGKAGKAMQTVAINCRPLTGN